MGAILTVDNINVYYGSIHAIKGISFEVNAGEIVTLIGANGAGKSTTLNTISGLLRSRTGSIQFMGEDLGKLPPHKTLSKGLALVPEGRRIFLQMTVQENLDMGAYIRKNNIKAELDMVYDYFPYMVLPIYSILAKLDGKLLEAARDLGCNSFSVLKRVVLPLSLPGIISGITMVLIPSISTFYISQKLGSGKFFLIGDAIEGQYVANNLHFAAAIAFILMLILLAGMALMKYFTTKHVYGGK